MHGQQLTQDSSPVNEGGRTTTSGGRKSPEGMIGKKKQSGREKIEAQTHLVGERGKTVERN